LEDKGRQIEDSENTEIDDGAELPQEAENTINLPAPEEAARIFEQLSLLNLNEKGEPL
jgi:hypothetical protein